MIWRATAATSIAASQRGASKLDIGELTQWVMSWTGGKSSCLDRLKSRFENEGDTAKGRGWFEDGPDAPPRSDRVSCVCCAGERHCRLQEQVPGLPASLK